MIKKHVERIKSIFLLLFCNVSTTMHIPLHHTQKKKKKRLFCSLGGKFSVLVQCTCNEIFMYELLLERFIHASRKRWNCFMVDRKRNLGIEKSCLENELEKKKKYRTALITPALKIEEKETVLYFLFIEFNVILFNLPSF